MPLTAVSASTAVVLGALLSAPHAAPTLDDLAFMAGAWESEQGGQSSREVWDPPRGDAMVGHFSMRVNDSAVLYELITIEAKEDRLAMHLRHFNRGLVPWASEADGPLVFELVEVDGDRAVFEDAERDFPRRIIYTREGDTLTALLEAADGVDEGPIRIEFAAAEE